MAIDPTILNGPRLKVERARRHIDELRTRSSPLDRELYSFRAVPQRQWMHIPDFKGSMQATPMEGLQLQYVPSASIAQTFSLIIGDALHNLRGALDHLASGIVNSCEKRDNIYFPMENDRNNLLDETRSGSSSQKSLERLEQALPGSKNLLLNEVRPNNSPDEPYWSFNSLNNHDKHKLLLPIISIANVENLNIISDLVRTTDMTCGGDATRIIGILFSHQIFHVEEGYRTSVEIRLSHEGTLNNQLAIPTLTRIASIVTKTIDSFESLITKHP